MGRFLLMPIAKVAYDHIQVNSYREKDTTNLLNVNYDGVNSFRGEFGLSFAPEFFPGCLIVIPQLSITQNGPFNSSKRQVYIQNTLETAEQYVSIDSTNLYFTRFSLALSYLFKKKLNCYLSGSHLINSGMKNTFEVLVEWVFHFKEKSENQLNLNRAIKLKFVFFVSDLESATQTSKILHVLVYL